MTNALPSTYDQLYQNQFPMHWIKPNITGESVNQTSLANAKYFPDAFPGGFFQSGRNGQGTLWKQAQQLGKSSKVRKCMCSCTSGVSQCTCGFSRQQEKLKTRLDILYILLYQWPFSGRLHQVLLCLFLT